MKANELMIGDWFQNPLGFPYKVKSIKCYNADKEDERYEVCGANKSAEASFDVINAEPIPLTPEILEKNGFRKDETDKYHPVFLLSEDYFDVTIEEETDSIWRLEYTNCEAPLPFCRNLVCSVHELQHALRLCGIDKEIVL